MMIGSNQIMKDLDDMYDYFMQCAENAAKESRSRKKYTQWATSLRVVATEIVLRNLREEDDGK